MSVAPLVLRLLFSICGSIYGVGQFGRNHVYEEFRLLILRVKNIKINFKIFSYK